MPANFLFAGMARSYTSKIFVGRGLACNHQRTIRRQPCSDCCVHLAIGDLCGHSPAAFGAYPHQVVSPRLLTA
jgi:hypothetical protein